MTTTIARGLREGRELVDPELFHRLVQRVAEEHDHDLIMAGRIVDQALAFLGTTATHEGRPLSASEIVDPGWHEFILHTVDYAEFCDRVAGRFLHHVPTDPDDESAEGVHDTLSYTVDAIDAAGFYVDTELWPTAHAGKCSQCHAGCNQLARLIDRETHMNRRSWDELPADVRNAIEARCGAILRTETPSAGRNSALSALLHTANGSVFVKGIPTDVRLFRAHRHEIRVNTWLRHRVSGVPCLLWTIEVGGWLLAGYEPVPGEHADFSPGSPDIPTVVDAISRLAEELTPSPAPDVAPLRRKYTRLAGWQWLADNHADQLDAWEKQHLDLLVNLDDEAPNALAGDSLVHADIHELNLLVDNGTVSVIDWAWSRTGPPWIDAALLTIRLIAEGHDPADAEQLVSGTWGIQHASATADALTTFAATTYGQWRRFSIEFPSPHREAPTRGAQLWTHRRLRAM